MRRRESSRSAIPTPSRYRLEAFEPRLLLSADLVGVPEWVERAVGPIAATPVSTGAIQAVAAHPQDAATIYVGSVNGGVWKTTNADQAPNVHWVPLTDQFPSLSVSAIAINPLDPDTIFAGTGNFSSAASLRLGGEPAGILRSTDGGLNWALFGRDEFSDIDVTGIIPVSSGGLDLGEVVAGGRLAGVDAPALLRSADGGETWNAVGLDLDGNGLQDAPFPHGHVTDLVFDRENEILYAAVVDRLPPETLEAEEAARGHERASFVLEAGDTGSLTVGDPRLYFSNGARGRFQGFDPDTGEITWTRLDGPPPGSGTILSVTAGEPDGPELARLRLTSNTSSEGPLFGSGIYRSRDQGKLWEPILRGIELNPLIPDIVNLELHGANDTRIRLSVSPAGIDGNNPIYAGFVLDDRLRALFRSETGTDGVSNDGDSAIDEADEVTWVPLSVPTSNDDPRANDRDDHPLNGIADDASEAFGTNRRDDDGDGEVDEAGELPGLHPSGQGRTHFSILADLFDPDEVYLGGDTQPMIGTGNDVGLGDFVGRIFHGDGAPGGWKQIVGNDPNGMGHGAHGTFPHADSRNMVHDALGRILEVDDGGIYRLWPNDLEVIDPAHPDRPVWEPLIGDLRLTEIYSIAYDPARDRILAGSQDNGTLVERASASGWVEILGGDGPRVGIDAERAFPVYYFSAQNLQGFLRVVLNDIDEDGDGAVDLQDDDEWDEIDLRLGQRRIESRNNSTETFDPTISFATQWALNAVDPDRIVIGTNFLYESADGGNRLVSLGGTRSGGRPRNPFPDFAGRVTALAYGSEDNHDVIYAAVEGSSTADANDTEVRLFLRSTRGGSLQHLASYPGSTEIRDIEVDPDDWERAFVLDAGSVHLTTDGGQSWATLQTRSSELLRNLQSIELVKRSGEEILLLGGLGGVLRCIDPDPAAVNEWVELGRGLPNVLVTDLHYDPADELLLAGTFGRGAWALSLAESPVLAQSTLHVVGTDGKDTINIGRNAANPELLDVFVNGVRGVTVHATAGDAGTLVDAVQASLVQRIEIDGLGDDDTIILDFGQGLVTPPGGIHVHGGAHATSGDTLVLAGADTSFIDLRAKRGVIQAVSADFARVGEIDILPEGVEQVDAPGISRLQVLKSGTDRLSREVPARDLPGSHTPLGASTIPGSLDGFGLQKGSVVADPVKPAIRDLVETTTGELVRRLLEEGPGGFPLSEIATSITDPEALRARLDGLDAVSGNVSLSDTEESLRFDVRIEGKELRGLSALTLFQEAAALNGRLELAVDVDAHLVLGVDDEGFFVDVEGSPEAELVVRNLRSVGVIAGRGSLGFLEVELSEPAESALLFDPELRLEIDLHDPGSDAEDGLIRPDELGPVTNDLATSAWNGGSEAPDLVFTGNFEVAAALPGMAAPFELGDARIRFTWIDIEDPQAVEISVAPGSEGQQLLDFLDATAQDFASGLTALASWFEEIASEDVLGAEIPFLGKSLGDVLGGVADDLEIADSAVLEVFEAFGEDGVEKVEILLDANLLEHGVSAGSPVRYRDAAGVEHVAEVDAVAAGFLVLRLAPGQAAPASDAPGLRIARPGSLLNQVTAFLGELSDPELLSLRIPTLQDLIVELSDRLGLEELLPIEVTGLGSDPTVLIPLAFDVEPLLFHTALDLDAGIPGLELAAGAELSLALDPLIEVVLGVRLGADLPLAERVFFAAEGTRIALGIQAGLDTPEGATAIAGGRIGFLDVELAEKDLASDGITLAGSIELELTDPGAGAAADGRIMLAELHPGSLLEVFDSTLDLELEIDPLELRVAVGNSGASLAPLEIFLDGPSEGKVSSLDDLAALAQKIHVEGDLASFLDWNAITPELILAALEALVEQLRALGAGGVVDTDLPLLNRSFADLVDLGQAWNERFGSASQANLFTAKGLEAFLNARLASGSDPVTVAVAPGEIRFGLAFGESFEPAPIALSLGLDGGVGLVTAGGAAVLQPSASVQLELELGIRSGGDLELAERIFLGTEGVSEIQLETALDAGYDPDGSEGPLLPTPLTFDASVGGLEAGVSGGALLLAELGIDLLDGGDGDGRLTLSEISENTGSGSFGNLFASPGLTGSAQAFFDLDVSDAPSATIEVAGRLENLANPVYLSFPSNSPLDFLNGDFPHPLGPGQLDPTEFQIATHGLEDLLASLFDFSSLLDGLETFLRWGGGLLGLDVLGLRLPFVGNSLGDAFDFFEGQQEGSLGRLVADLRSAAETGDLLGGRSDDVAIAQAARALRDALDALDGVSEIGDADGDGVDPDDMLQIERGTEKRSDTVSDATVIVLPDGLFEAITEETGTDFLLLGHGVAAGDVVTWGAGFLSGSGRVTAVTPHRLVVGVDPGAPLPSEVQPFSIETRNVAGVSFLARFAREIHLPTPFDLGLDFLAVRSPAVAVDFALGLDLLLGFGIDRRGFFVTTDFADLVDQNGDPISGPELSLAGEIALSGSIPLTLGFLDLVAGFDGQTSQMSAAFSGDLLAGGFDPGKLRLAELLDLGRIADHVELGLEVEAHVDAQLSVGAGSELPALAANLLFDWGPFDATGGAPAPVLRLEDVRLDLGSFVDRVVGPLFSSLEAFNVLEPLADLLDVELPIIGKTPLELLLGVLPDGGARDTFELLLDVSGKLAGLGFDAAREEGSGRTIGFGTVSVTGVGGRASATTDLSAGEEASRHTATDAAGRTIPGSGLPFIGGFLTDLGQDLGITFPVLRVANLLQLLIGNDVDLAFAELPRFEAEVSFSQAIPIVTVGIPKIAGATLEVFFGGSLGVFAEVTLGFDTRGLRGEGTTFTDGIYLGDFAPGSDGVIGVRDRERAEVVLEATLFAGIDGKAFIGPFDVLRVIGKASLVGRLGIDLNDDNEEVAAPGDPRTASERSDGRFHVDEIDTVLDSHGGELVCMFDLTGQLLARLEGRVKVPFFSDPKFSDEWVIADFTLGCDPEELAIDLAYLDGSTLVLTSTDESDEEHRLTRSGTNHPDGDAVRILLVDKDRDGETETLRVEKNGRVEDFGPDEPDENQLESLASLALITDVRSGLVGGEDLTRLDGFGAGPDLVTVDPAIETPVVLHGQAGDDVLVGGSGGATLVGGPGDDQLDLADGDATLVGGGGDDVLTGAGGDDRLIGDYDARLDPRPSSAAEGSDQLEGRGGDDLLWGDNRRFDDDASDGPTPAATRDARDHLAGGGGSDTIFAGADDDRVDGDELGGGPGASPGDDLVYGGPGADTVIGSDGDDVLVGGPGDDRLEGGVGDDEVFGGNDTLGPDASGQGEDLLLGGAGDDLLDGSDSHFVVSRAGSGDDTLLGSRGADALFAEDGRDFIVAGPNNDRLEGGIGADDLVGGKGLAAGAFFPIDVGPADGADALVGGAGDDVLVGDGGVVFAGELVVTVAAGGAGRDAILGGPGDDVIFGGGLGDLLEGDGAADAGRDLIVGDQGVFDFATILASVAASGAGTAGDDSLSGGGADDILIGGAGADVVAGGSGADVLLGDHASVSLEASLVLRIASREPEEGGDDLMTGDAGPDVLIGGPGNDDLSGGEGDAGADILLGDGGLVVRGDASAEAYDVFTADPGFGGTDLLAGGPGDDILAGGALGDVLRGGTGRDVLLGDEGVIRRNATEAIESIATAFPLSGGADLLEGGLDDDVSFGGAAGDEVRGDEGADVLLGDNGLLDFAADGDLAGLDRIESDRLAGGGSDTVAGGAGADVEIGGAQGDLLFGDAPAPGPADGRDILLGDNGVLLLVASGAAGASGGDAIGVLGGVVTRIRTSDEEHSTGGSDQLFGDDADDVLAGGVAGDLLHGNTGADVLLGDNARLEWLYAGDPAFAAIEAGFVFDASAATLDLVTTELPAVGGRDVLFGDTGADLLFGGTDADALFGDGGDESGAGFGADDILFGDHGRVYPRHSALPAFSSRNFFAIDTGDLDGGEGDRLFGEEGDDLLLGQQGDDRLFGGAGDDDLVGGHNVAGGVDELSAPAVEASRNPAVNDLLDGGAGDDALAGDNAAIWRAAERTSPRFRSLEGDRLYHPDDGAPAVGADPRLDPHGAVGRAVTLLDHAAGLEGATGARPFGDDLLAGGADHDLLFGELGDDVLQGDGALVPVPGPAADPSFEVLIADTGAPVTGEVLLFRVTEEPADGDDYVEGGGGDDQIYGGLGQDDLIGGSSSLFGLATPAQRPDGSDAIFGGAGTRTARNDPGDASAEGHARDADAILGDNGDLYRIVGTNGTDAGSFLGFVYDDYSASLRLVPRAARLLDYTPGGVDFDAAGQAGDRGAADVVHGESGDDSVHGMKGDDVLFGDGQDDDLIGGYGRDWISGGTGRDGILGDDGRIATSRNGTAGEPLYGIAGLAASELGLRISTPGNHQQAIINVTGELKKQVDLTPFHLSPAGALADLVSFDPADADDILYGGLGGDWVHGGSGDDAISGAEALASYYAAPANPGDVLDYGGVQAGEFAAYDENDPWRKILVGGQEFLLNFSATEGAVDPRSALGRTTDGDDRLFGDLGHDWLVGGTGRDRLYGGLGDDLLNADDDHETNAGANDAPDTDASYEDTAYGGGGRDVLIGNTGGDRLIDWVGEWNSYVVPFAPFGVSTVSRTLQPQLPEYLYALSRADGADPTRAADTAGDSARNGEPFGELGLVVQRDALWQDATGGPADPQAGNIGGSRRDVLRSLGFDSGAPAGVALASGTWTVEQGRYVGAMERLAADLNGDGVVGAPDYALLLDRAFGTRAAGHPADLNLDGAVGGPDLAFLVRQLGRRAAADVVSVLDLEVSLPRHFELEATLRLGTEAHANGYLIFDYQGPEEFRFAGLDAASQTLRIGSRDAQGWQVLAEQALPVERGRDYRVRLSVNGLVATLAVDGMELASHAFVPRRSADGAPEGLENGRLGVGSQRAMVAVDELEVRAPWLGTFFEHVEDFADGAAQRFDGPETGAWIVEAGQLSGAPNGNQDSAITTFGLTVEAAARLELEATLAPESLGGFFFAYQGNRDWSFAALLPDTQQVVIGHATQQGIAYDAVADLDPAAGPDYELRLSLVGSTVSVSVDGHEVLGHGFAAGVTAGGFGLLSAGGATSFDRLAVRTDDEAAVAATGAVDFAIRVLAVDPTAREDEPDYVITEIPLDEASL